MHLSDELILSSRRFAMDAFSSWETRETAEVDEPCGPSLRSNRKTWKSKPFSDNSFDSSEYSSSTEHSSPIEGTDASDTLRDFCENNTSVSFDGSSAKVIDRLIA